jgi:DNA invertase Pin-like site-specific DNA recombinase
MFLGYARVSTTDQSLDLQKDALEAAGCQHIFTDIASGAKAERKGLEEALQNCRPDDTLIVWKLDRLGRSLPHLVETVRDLVERGVGFKSLKENIDTTTSGGKLIFHIFASLAEFERDIIRERTIAGLSAARARGRKGGRPKGVDEKKKQAAISLKKDLERSVKEICELVGISRNTYYKYTRTENPESETAQNLKNQQPPKPEKKVMQVKLWLKVENNSKFVRGKSKSRRDIEDDVLSNYDMEKPYKDGDDYILSIPYTTDDELEQIINDDIFAEAHRIADDRNGFIEYHMVSVDDPDRIWD